MKSVIAVCQMSITRSKSKNMEMIASNVQDAAKRGAKVIFFPEACDYVGGSKEETIELAESSNDSYITSCKKLAKDNNVWLSLGGFHESNTKDKIKLSHVVINDHGQVIAKYHKAHMFRAEIAETGLKLDEAAYCQPGDIVPVPIDTPVGKLGLGVCYDLRFPEFSLLQRRWGADILTFPSAFTVETGRAHWEILLRARAIETQCYVIAAAQYGQLTEKRSCYGHSLVIDPWGAIIGHTSNNTESIILADIDLDFLKSVRQKIPSHQHRRDDIYSLTSFSPKAIGDSPVSFAVKQIPAEQVFLKTEFSYAFVNIKPVLPGHVLVSPLRYVNKLSNLNANEISDLFMCVQKVQSLLESFYQTDSTTITIQDGPEAGQTIAHLHVHILPRKAGDFENNDDVYEHLAKHDKYESPVRNGNEMATEAQKYREHFFANINH